MQQVRRAEALLRKRLPIGSTASRRQLVRDLVAAQHDENAVTMAIDIMLKRDDMQAMARGQMVKRVK
jgi:hypothetical protein